MPAPRLSKRSSGSTRHPELAGYRCTRDTSGSCLSAPVRSRVIDVDDPEAFRIAGRIAEGVPTPARHV
jgi:hypothetical protein